MVREINKSDRRHTKSKFGKCNNVKFSTALVIFVGRDRMDRMFTFPITDTDKWCEIALATLERNQNGMILLNELSWGKAAKKSFLGCT